MVVGTRMGPEAGGPALGVLGLSAVVAFAVAVGAAFVLAFRALGSVGEAGEVSDEAQGVVPSAVAEDFTSVGADSDGQ